MLKKMITILFIPGLLLFAACDLEELVDDLVESPVSAEDFEGDWEIANSTATTYNDLSISVDGSEVSGMLQTSTQNGSGYDTFSGILHGSIEETHLSAIATDGDSQIELELDINDDKDTLTGTFAFIKMSGYPISNPVEIPIEYIRK